MSDNKVGLPSSGGGLVRYFEDYKSKIEIKPAIILTIIIIVAVVEIYLYKFM